MAKRVVVWSRVWLAVVFMMSTILLSQTARSDEASQIRLGFDIVAAQFGRNFLNLAGKNRELVGLGSYLVNTTGCNDCHTYPNWADITIPTWGSRSRSIRRDTWRAGDSLILQKLSRRISLRTRPGSLQG